MNPDPQHHDVRELILENQRLLTENNILLKKMHRSAVRHSWFNIAWIVIFLGLPLLAFYKLAVPFYSSFEASPTSMQQLNELRGLLEQ